MIEELTEEQIGKFDEYVKKYVSIGLDTTNISAEETEKIINDIYSDILNKAHPEKIIIKDSPMSAWKYICDVVGRKMDFVSPYFMGSFDSNIFCFYDFNINELGVKIENKLMDYYTKWREILKVGPVYPFDDVCIVSKKPCLIHKNENGLHCETGPAVKYEDGFEVYALNGVVLDKKWVMTPFNDIDVKEAMAVDNVEVRRELVRKIGIETICEKMDADVADEKDDYQLLLLDIGDGNKRPYLKMTNPSIGTYHVEGVHPDCKTVADALEWRNGTKEVPSQLT
jgi:hypothetical protein